MNNHTTEHPADRMCTVLKRGDDAKVAAAASEPPKKVFIFFCAGLDRIASGGDDFGRAAL